MNILKTELRKVSETTYAAAAGTSKSKDKNGTQPSSIKEAIKEAWREEEAEENDKLKRACNVIVHGVIEQDKSEDKAWAEDLLKATFTKVNIGNIFRLGKATDDKKREICFANEDEETKQSFLVIYQL